MATQAYKGDTTPLVDDQGNGTHINLVKVVGGGGGGGSSDTTEATQLLVLNELQNLDTNVGAQADAAAPESASGSFSLVSAVKRILLQGVSFLSLFGAGLPKQLSSSGALLIGNNRSKIRDEFPAGGLNPDLWDLIATGAGMTVTTGNGTTGSYLNINSGVNINSETIIRSKEAFFLPVRLAAFVTASQRIANTEFFVELVEVNPVTGAPVTVPASQANAGNYRNHASVKFDGVSATSAIVTARSGGAPEFVAAAATITTTAATGVSPNFFPAGFVEAQISGEHVTLLQAAIDTLLNATGARRVTQSAPNPEVPYKLQFRLRNLGTAPASATDYRLHTIRLFDFTRLTTEILGGPGHSTAAMSVPTVVNNSVPIASLPALVAGTAFIGNVGGAAAHDAVVSGNPNRIAGRALTAPYTAVATGDTADLVTTLQGSLVVQPFSIPEVKWDANVLLTTTSDVVLATAAGAGLKRHVTSLWAINSGAADVELILKDGATERKRYLLKVGVPTPVTFPGGGPVATANTACNAALSAANTGVRLDVEGYTGT